MKTKQITAAIIAAAITMGAAANAASFPDVNAGDWYYETVTAMTDKGLFSGVEENGAVYFKPDNTMTRAEFIAVVDRILELDTSKKGKQWWYGAYQAALDADIITGGEMSAYDMDNAITRREMAMVAVRAIKKKGEILLTLYADNVIASIPDYDKIGSYYDDFVVTAYANGILCGIDDNGTFNPEGTLTRSAAATVLNRIIEPSTREQRDFLKNPNQSANDDEPITIHEGEVSQRRFARAGDTVVKADGTEVVLSIGPHGVLGEGQGVAPDLGLEVPTGGNRRVEAYKVFSGLTDFKDSTGKSVINAPYYVNKLTGEGHWGSEWMAMTSEPTTEGTFEYQLSEDKNWIWLGGGWIDMSVQNPTEADLQTIRDANGLN